jgi:predicted Zn finger-like uncharacterized protein
VFRVVADQLRISDGWVRCGQCAAVFQGNEHLWMPQMSLPSHPPAPDVVEPSVVTGSDLAQSLLVPMSDEVAMLASAARRDIHPAEADALTGVEREALSQEFAGAAAPPGVMAAAADDVALTPLAETLLNTRPRPFSGWDPHGVANDESPAFVRRARRIAFWSSTRMRMAVGGTVLVALLTLLLQWAWFDRDRLAARWPSLHSPMAALCAMVGCELTAPRAIESLVLDSSSFLRVRGDVFRLTFLVRHNAQHSVKTPHVELTLTDMDDQPIMRSVWAPGDLSAQAPSVIRRGESWSASTLLAVEAASRVAGYRLLTFYP